MKQSKNASEMIELMNIVDDIDMSEEAMLEIIKDPNSISGPGSKKQKSPNDYKPQDIQVMLKYIASYIKSGTTPKSWKGDFQSYLNTVGKGMEKFKMIKLGNPGYKEGVMKGDMMNTSYHPNK